MPHQADDGDINTVSLRSLKIGAIIIKTRCKLGECAEEKHRVWRRIFAQNDVSNMTVIIWVKKIN